MWKPAPAAGPTSYHSKASLALEDWISEADHGLPQAAATPSVGRALAVPLAGRVGAM